MRAAGGVVSRPGLDGRPEVLLVYRARRDDWTFPKGKLQPGEDEPTCARREVEEETGLRCELGPELATTAYRTRSGRLKQVRYWAMRPVGGTAGPDNEVDEIRWADLEMAAILLTHRRDRGLLALFVRMEVWRFATRLRRPAPPKRIAARMARRAHAAGRARATRRRSLV